MSRCIFINSGHCLNPKCRFFEQVVNDDSAQYEECQTEETWRQKEGTGEFPSLAKQAVTFLQSLLQFKKSSKAEQIRRLSICSHCDFRQFTRCTKCGCFIAKKVKKEEQECPEGYW